MYVESKSARVTGVHTCQRQPPPPWSAAPLTGAPISHFVGNSRIDTRRAQGRAGPSHSGAEWLTLPQAHTTQTRARIRAEARPWDCCTQGDYGGSEHLPLGGQQREDRRGLRRRARGDQMAEFAKDVRADLPQAAHPLVSLL